MRLRLLGILRRNLLSTVTFALVVIFLVWSCQHLKNFPAEEDHAIKSTGRVLRCGTLRSIKAASDKRIALIKKACRRHFREYFPVDVINWSKYKSRKRHVEQGEWFDRLIVIENFDAVYMALEKCGSTNLKYYIQHMSKDMENYKYNASALSKWHLIGSGDWNRYIPRANPTYNIDKVKDVETAREIVNSYYKFVFFRDPLDRLYSSWKYFFDYPSTHWIMADKIEVRMKYENETEVDRLTFTDYVQNMLDYNNTWKFNRHWRPQAYTALPCEIEYDFVGTIESMSCDMVYLARRFLKGVPVPLKRRRKTYRSIQISEVGADPDLVRKMLAKHFKVDYDLLGFEMP